jgi:hypothetical protein
MISKADKRGKGRVDFQDFLALLENVSQRERRGNEPPSLWNLCHFTILATCKGVSRGSFC